MKVILTEDVDKVGAASEVVEVADGYARNYLLPRSLAMPATKSALANLDHTRQVRARREGRLLQTAEEQARQLEGKPVVIPVRAGASGRLFGSVGTADITRALKEQMGVEIERRQLQLSQSIRTVGLHPVPLQLHRNLTVQLVVQVGEGDFEPLTTAAVDPAGDATAETVAASEAA